MTGTAIALLSVLGSVASIVAFWVKDPLLPEKMKERARKRARLSTLDAVAAELFTVVRDQAHKEVRNARDRLNIGWELASGGQAGSSLAELAEEAERWGADPETWTKALEALKDPTKGSEKKLGEFLLHCVPTRRMLIVGGAGTGKSYLLNLIAYHWDKRAETEHEIPIPVVLSLSSWDPRRQRLMDWVALALQRVHPFLAAPTGEGHAWAAELVWRQRVLPLLDGLDEIPPELFEDAIQGIGEVDDGLGLVVTYRAESGKRLDLKWDTAITLRPSAPDLKEVRAFLCGARSKAENRWSKVLAELAKGQDLRSQLATPLMLDLARTIYNPTRLRRTPFDPEPAKLLQEATGPRSLKDHLLHCFIPAVYAPRDAPGPHKRDRWGAEQVAPWFVSLAGHLKLRAKREREAAVAAASGPSGSGRERWWSPRWYARELAAGVASLAASVREFREGPPANGTREVDVEGRRDDDLRQDIEWWRLHDPGQKATFAAAVGSLCGTACGLAAGLGSNSGVGFGIDLGAGIAVALTLGYPFYALERRSYARAAALAGGSRAAPREPVRKQDRREDPYVVDGRVGLARATATGVKDWFQETWRRIRDSPISPMSGLAGGLAGGVLGGLVAGLEVKLGYGHSSGVADSLAAGVGIGLGSGPALGRVGGFFGALAGGLVAGPLVGVGVGVPAGVLNGIATAVAIALIIVRAPSLVPTSRPTWRPIGIVGGLAAGLAVGATAWAPAGRSLDVALRYGLVVGVVAGAASGLIGRAVPRLEVSSPRASLGKDRSAFLLIVVSVAIATGVTALLIVGFNAEYELHKTRIAFHTVIGAGLLTGVAVGLTCGLVLASVQSPWGQFVVTRWCLALSRKLPLRLVTFLEEAQGAERGVLRTSGPSYRFKHLELQQYLARRAAEDDSSQDPGDRGEDEPAERADEGMLADQDGRGDHEERHEQAPDAHGPPRRPRVEGEQRGGGHMLAGEVVEGVVVGVDEAHDPAARSRIPLRPRRIARVEDEEQVAEEVGEDKREGDLRDTAL